jgi:hypothetical protein
MVVGIKLKGTLITFKENLFKQGNHISQTPTYPMFLSQLTIISSIKIDNLELPHNLREKDRKTMK